MYKPTEGDQRAEKDVERKFVEHVLSSDQLFVPLPIHHEQDSHRQTTPHQQHDPVEHGSVGGRHEHNDY